MVKIIVDQVITQFETETHFCHDFLEIEFSRWQGWKKGRVVLNTEEMQKVKNLFSDYEWMLSQKIIRQTILFPEKRNYVVMEYKRVKSLIAKQWLQSGEATMELISQRDSQHKGFSHNQRKEIINLRISMNYGAWGYDDILEFTLPAVIQKQMEDSRVDLLEWVNENLTDTYTATETN